MNKLLLLLSVIILHSCAGVYQQAAVASESAYLGMPIQDFKDQNGRKAKLEAMESGFTVYRMDDYNVWTGAYEGSKFFYFDSTSKLYKIDTGEFKQQRYQIEVINKE